MRRSPVLALSLILTLGTTAAADTGEHVSTLGDQRGVGITIYNADLALVRDRRHVTLPKGESHLALRDVSARIQPETALLTSLTAPSRLNVTFRNQGGSLGVPLPKGAVRVYKRENSGTAQFVGSDTIDHTPKNETVRLHLGDSFDVTVSKKQTDYKSLGGSVYETAYEIVLRNAKPAAETVHVVEPIPGDWRMLSSSARYEKSSSSTATWVLRVPAESSTKLTYRVRVKD